MERANSASHQNRDQYRDVHQQLTDTAEQQHECDHPTTES